MRLVRSSILTALTLAAITACNGNDSDPQPSPPPRSNYLQEYLDSGKCKVAVAIWSESDRTAANTYVKSNGGPTDACPNPNVRVIVNTDQSVTTGAVVEGRKVIRYQFGGAAG